MYSSSVTTGDWETYIAADLDRLCRRSLPHARAAREPRLSGPFDGRLRHGAHRYEAPRCVRRAVCDELVLLADRSRARRRRGHARRARARGSARARRATAARRPDPAAGFANALSAQAAAWAPNPDNPPEYFDLPFKNGELDPLVAAKWLANAPLAHGRSVRAELEALSAIALDVGNADPLARGQREPRRGADAPSRATRFEEYEGDHGNRVRERFASKVLPFFSEQLDAVRGEKESR